jgi:hypothetical protein
MRIALRTSGGRGEYELAGNQGPILASTLFDHQIAYELTPTIIIHGRAAVLHMQGKPRIRLDEHTRTSHFYLLLAGVLLLPSPKRELSKTLDGVLLKKDSYSMTTIKVDVGRIEPRSVTLRPTDLIIATADGDSGRIDFAQRMSDVIRMWDAAADKNTALADLLKRHKQAIMAPDPNHKAILLISESIERMVDTEEDPLPLIARDLGVELGISSSPEMGVTSASDYGLVDEKTATTAKSEAIKKWRLISVRGKAGVKFREDVTRAYNYRCMFTGKRLPRLDVTSSVGVDASHILPWSTHGINSVPNGICLDKLCHWAFDEGILRLSFDATGGKYNLSVPETVSTAAVPKGFEIDYFRALTGPIPEDRLPVSPAQRPSPSFLTEFNKFASAT